VPPIGDWPDRRLHFVGIGGAGMSGLALIAKSLGAQVTGSDRAESNYLSELRAAGIEPVIGHAAANVPPGAEVVYSSAVGPENPERAAASREHGGRGELHRADLLAQLTELKRCLAVTGTHGKTTTTAMIVHVLQACGLDPSYVVGGELRGTDRNAAWGSGEWIVVEADESDRSLLKLRPEVAVLTNAELDHHATYASSLDLNETLMDFLDGAAAAVVWDRPELLVLAAGASRIIPYDAEDPRSSPAGVTLRWEGLEVDLRVPGVHNAINAAGALTAAALAGAEPVAAAAAIRSFRGARRRFERLGETAAGASVYDDYAHHPTEVAVALAAARTLGPRRLIAVFQPHLYSRTRALARRFGEALAAADVCCVTDIYAARELADDFPGIDGRLVAVAAADAGDGRPVAWLPSLDSAEGWLRSELRDGDLCLVMGAGDVDSLGRALLVGTEMV
jgi:UDP-N-acetylmuramate--alanine ligase